MKFKIQYATFRTAVNRAVILLSKPHNVTPPILCFMRFAGPAVTFLFNFQVIFMSRVACSSVSAVTLGLAFPALAIPLTTAASQKITAAS